MDSCGREQHVRQLEDPRTQVLPRAVAQSPRTCCSAVWECGLLYVLVQTFHCIQTVVGFQRCTNSNQRFSNRLEHRQYILPSWGKRRLDWLQTLLACMSTSDPYKFHPPLLIAVSGVSVSDCVPVFAGGVVDAYFGPGHGADEVSIEKQTSVHGSLRTKGAPSNLWSEIYCWDEQGLCLRHLWCMDRTMNDQQDSPLTMAGYLHLLL